MSDTIEPVEDFRLRARRWIEANLERRSAEAENSHRPDRDRDRRIQTMIFDAGFAGLAVPRAYGGAGLTLDHQRVWAEETDAYVRPTGYMVSLGIMLPTLLDHGTEAVKQRHIPRLLRGEESWIQLLSEPSGGSDMAGALTRATRRGEAYVISGSKMWSSNANYADYGMCLARVNWDAPKHQGLGMFCVPLKDARVDIKPIIPAQGGEPHFFIEYFDDVEVPAEYVLGGEGDGWTVAQRLLFHERSATAGVAYGYGMGGGESEGRSSWRLNIAEIARRYGSIHAPELAAQIADDYIDLVVGMQLGARINAGTRSGKLEGHWGSLLKLGLGIDSPANAETALAAAGADGVVWTDGNAGGEVGLNWLRVRGVSIAGGSNEIQRNIVSERLLGLPREPGEDIKAPFSELMKARSARRS